VAVPWVGSFASAPRRAASAASPCGQHVQRGWKSRSVPTGTAWGLVLPWTWRLDIGRWAWLAGPQRAVSPWWCSHTTSPTYIRLSSCLVHGKRGRPVGLTATVVRRKRFDAPPGELFCLAWRTFVPLPVTLCWSRRGDGTCRVGEDLEISWSIVQRRASKGKLVSPRS